MSNEEVRINGKACTLRVGVGVVKLSCGQKYVEAHLDPQLIARIKGDRAACKRAMQDLREEAIQRMRNLLNKGKRR